MWEQFTTREESLSSQSPQEKTNKKVHKKAVRLCRGNAGSSSNRAVHAQLLPCRNPPRPESPAEVQYTHRQVQNNTNANKKRKKKNSLSWILLDPIRMQPPSCDVTASIRYPAGACSSSAADCRRFVWELLHSWASGSDLRPAMTQGLVAGRVLRSAARKVFIGVWGTVREWQELSNKAALGLNC